MRNAVRIAAGTVLKRFADAGKARQAVYAAQWARDCGVNTPQATLRRSGRTVAFPYIGGTGGLSAIAQNGSDALVPLMRPVVLLHAMTPPPQLRPLAPLRKIVSRASPTAERLFGAAIADALDEIDRLANGNGVVHGDLHAGQLVIDGEQTAWLLDLDDLAIAPPAADLGNFAAHLATRPETARGDPVSGMRAWLPLVERSYRAAGGVADMGGADAFGRIALVRRALKAAERGDGALSHTVLAGM